MSRIHLAAIPLSILLLGQATGAMAKVRDPATCTIPDLITLVGRDASGGADPLGIFTLVVRDWGWVPAWGERITLDFSDCPDIQLCADQRDPSIVLDCAGRSLDGVSDSLGRVTFRVIGCATNQGASPGSTGSSLKVWAEGGLLLKSVRVAALDQDGMNGVDGHDFSLFLADYFSGQSFARSDYDGDGTVGGNDMSLWLAAFYAGGSVQSGGTACP